jgi:hypothetical protein
VARQPITAPVACRADDELELLATQFHRDYVASAIYIALFMWWFGRYAPARGLVVGLAVAAVLFSDVRNLVPGAASEGTDRTPAGLPSIFRVGVKETGELS